MIECRFCGKRGMHPVLDLGHTPPSNSFLTKEQLLEPEVTYPLKIFVCDSCWLVQVDEYKKAEEIFKEDYVYFSSQSPSNVSHAKEFADMVCQRFFKEPDTPKVMEIGSNDGYMLQWFKNKGCKVLGWEPAEGPYLESIKKGINTLQTFFNKDSASAFNNADLICSINVLAHQPDINDFVKGLKIALAPKGVIVMEFPHLMHLIDECQFDTIYHEHFSYFSLTTVCEIFKRHGLEIFDVDEIPEHGGSLRIYAQHETPLWEGGKVVALRLREHQKGMFSIRYYEQFQGRVDRIKHKLVRLLTILSTRGKKVCAYGAAAKGNTLLNYCGIRPDLVPYVIDKSPHKIGKYLPGSHIPVVSEDSLRGVQGVRFPGGEHYILNRKPDYILILPWNIKEEIMNQLNYTRGWGCKFIIPVPEVEIV